MASDDTNYTYNEMSNEDRSLLLAHGIKPGELEPDEERELIRDWREENDNDPDSEGLSGNLPGESRDGTE